MSTDTTTTVLDNEIDEDKTLILTARERLKYFKPKSEPVMNPLSKRPPSIWNKIRRYLH